MEIPICVPFVTEKPAMDLWRKAKFKCEDFVIPYWKYSFVPGFIYLFSPRMSAVLSISR